MPGLSTCSGSLVSWCMSMMWAMQRSSCRAARALFRLGRDSKVTRNHTAMATNTRLLMPASSPCIRSMMPPTSSLTCTKIGATTITPTSAATAAQAPVRKPQCGRRSDSTRDWVSCAIDSNSLDTCPRPDPGKRSQMRRSRVAAVAWINLGSSWR